MIAHVQKWRPSRAALAAEDSGNLGRQMPDRAARRIDYIPVSISSEILSAGKVS
jgi:hypothetical protein